MELLFISSKKTVIKIYNAANKIAFRILSTIRPCKAMNSLLK